MLYNPLFPENFQCRISGYLLRIRYRVNLGKLLSGKHYGKTFDDKPTLLQEMVWFRRATSHSWAKADLGLWRYLVSLGHNDRPGFMKYTASLNNHAHTVYPKKYAHGFVVLCFVMVRQSFIMNSHEVFIHIHQGCFAGTGAIVRLPQCQWSKPDGYGEISQCITRTKHSKAKTVCIFLGIYCSSDMLLWRCLWTHEILTYFQHGRSTGTGIITE